MSEHVGGTEFVGGSYRAYCDCNWQGFPRRSRNKAEAELHHHIEDARIDDEARKIDAAVDRAEECE